MKMTKAELMEMATTMEVRIEMKIQALPVTGAVKKELKDAIYDAYINSGWNQMSDSAWRRQKREVFVQLVDELADLELAIETNYTAVEEKTYVVVDGCDYIEVADIEEDMTIEDIRQKLLNLWDECCCGDDECSCEKNYQFFLTTTNEQELFDGLEGCGYYALSREEYEEQLAEACAKNSASLASKKQLTGGIKMFKVQFDEKAMVSKGVDWQSLKYGFCSYFSLAYAEIFSHNEFIAVMEYDEFLEESYLVHFLVADKENLIDAHGVYANSWDSVKDITDIEYMELNVEKVDKNFVLDMIENDMGFDKKLYSDIKEFVKASYVGKK